MTDSWILLLEGWGLTAVVMVGFWQLQRTRGNAGIVDVVWTAAVGMLAIFFSFFAQGYVPRRVIIATIAGIWSIRLTGYLFVRLKKSAEDGRYQTLREQWGERAQFYLFLFFQVQAFWAVLFAFPMLVAANNETASLGILDAFGVLCWIVSLVGESIADRQLAQFRQDPDTKGKVCRRGLWYYSRHPNYFFEWIHWWAYVFLGIQGSYGWLTLLGPATMLYFLLKVTGIPPTEAQALKSRGDAYREYQRTTSVFFPWPPKEST